MSLMKLQSISLHTSHKCPLTYKHIYNYILYIYIYIHIYIYIIYIYIYSSNRWENNHKDSHTGHKKLAIWQEDS